MLNVSHVDLHYGAAQILFDISFEAKEASSKTNGGLYPRDACLVETQASVYCDDHG